MAKYDDRVFAVFKKLAGKKFQEVLITAQELESAGKSPERALADSLEIYKLDGSVNS